MEDAVQDAALVVRVRRFCERRGIVTTGALALTVQRNRSPEFASLIVDFETETLHNLYPQAFGKTYKECRVAEEEEFLFCYHEALDTAPLRQATPLPEAGEDDPPFCCDALEPYRPRPTAHDAAFRAFVDGRGSVENKLFEVKRQVDNGPLLSTRLFELRDSRAVPRPDAAGSARKVHTFKNYKCRRCGLFFGVDLYAPEAGYSQHHMRCSAFAKRNPALEDAFLQAHGV